MKKTGIACLVVAVMGLLACDLGLFTPKGRLNPTDPDFKPGTDPRLLIKQGPDTLWTGGSYDFGTVRVGETRQVDFTIRNMGGSDLVLSQTAPVSLAGLDAAQFSIATPPAGTVKAGEETTCSLGFTPTSAGVKSAVLKVASNDPLSAVYALSLRGTGSLEAAVVAVTEVTLDESTVTLAVGGTKQLTATVAPSDATNKKVIWSTSYAAVATVGVSGLVIGVAAGTATIIVTTEDGGKTDTCAVTVTAAAVAVSGVTLNKTAMTVTAGGTEQLTATVTPADATNKAVSWASSDGTKATVSASGLVSALAVGGATITATTEDGGKSADCAVTVTAAAVAVSGVTLDQTAVTVPVGGTAQLAATVAPADATNKNVSWDSSYPSVATVGAGGLVIGVAAGTATIIVTTADGAKTDTCTVDVVVPVTGVSLNKTATTILLGHTEQLAATIAPASATNKTVSWSSSDEAKATVSAAGLVSAVAAGTAEITVTTADGEETAACTVTVAVAAVAVTGVTLDPSAVTVAVGGTEQLAATVAPAGATNQNVSWSSDDEAKATVDSGGVVTGVAAGTATITVTTEDGLMTDTCAVTVQAVPASVTTSAVTGITSTAAACGGEVTADGGAVVSARGICWSTGTGPTTADSHTSDGTGTGVFESSLTGLQAGALYHVRAYATNSAGTSYGNEVSFTTRYTVTYEGNGSTGGTVYVDPDTYTQGQTVTVLGNPGSLTRTGYALTGWNTQADGNGTPYTQGLTFLMSTANVTLYAVWTALPTYTVSYNGNEATGGDVPTDSTAYLEGETVTVLGNTGSLVKTGFAFMSWNTLANGGGTSYTAPQTFAMGTANVTLYARWAPTYTVSYDGNGATGSVPTDSTAYLEGQTVTVQGNSGGLAVFAYYFAGWNTHADGSGTPYAAYQTFAMGTANVALFAQWAPAIITMAGTGTAGNTGDGGAATSAQLSTPSHIALDTSGNLYIADYNNCNVRKVSLSTGIITLVAGDGTLGYGGDEGPATEAKLKYPNGVAVDASGNVYIADSGNHRIRKVDTSGNISTVAGNGTSGYVGDGVLATSTRINYPRGIAVVASGELYIADTNNHRIRKVDTSGIISTVAGTGTSGYSGDGGAATAAQISMPYGIAFDASGSFYLAEYGNSCVRKVDVDGIISRVAGTGSAGYSGDGGAATSAMLRYPSGVTVDDSSSSLYIADYSNHRIRKVILGSGIISTMAGTGTAGYSGDGGPATSAQLSYPIGVDIDASGDLFIADYTNHRIRRTHIQQ